MTEIFRKPKIGVLLIEAERFRGLGEGTARGTYAVRKDAEAAAYIEKIKEFADVVYPGPVWERDGAESAARLFYNEGVDCVAAGFLSWAEDFAWIRFLRELPPMPLFFMSVVRDSLSITDTNDEDQFIDFLSAGALVGFQEASGSFRRFDRPMSEMCIGTLDTVTARLKTFASAARVRSTLRASRISLLSCYNEAMWATYLDPYNIFMKIGPEIHFLSVAELVNEINRTPDETVRKITDELTSSHEVYPNVDMEKLDASVRASYAMERIALAAGTDLLVLNDIDTVLFREVGLRPGFAPTSEDLPLVTVPEGDIGGGLATYILHALTGRRSNFIEPFYIDHVRGPFAAGHAGPNDYRDPDGKMIIARDERFAKSGWKHAGAPFAWYVFPEGEKTMLHMSEKDGKMKMVCAVVDCLPTPHYLASYSHADFAPRGMSPEELFSRIAANGVTQHYGIVPGDVTAELADLAGIMGFDFCKIS